MTINFVRGSATCKQCVVTNEHPATCIRCGECGRQFDKNGSITNFFKFPSYYPMPNYPDGVGNFEGK